MFTLIGLGTGAAYLSSVFATFFPIYFQLLSGHARAVPVYFEAAAVITTLVCWGSSGICAQTTDQRRNSRAAQSRPQQPICSQRTERKRCCARSGKVRRPFASSSGERVLSME